ncbi:MAG: hypothetical protein QOG64_1405 [Acidimicrobiaceae bacterium]|nr:hypothetical protein [Acidimicrobiaceae bacterium]
MLSGAADLDVLAAVAPTISAFATEALSCPGAEVFQVVHEVWWEGSGSALPPGLHPVNPPAVTWSFVRAPESEVGPFTLAQMRIVCRSGVRGRGFHVSCFVDNADAALMLRAHWGFKTSMADVSLERLYHGTYGTVSVEGQVVLDVRLLSPQPLSSSDLQYTDTMHLAGTPGGLRLVQVEQTFAFGRAERGRPVLAGFDRDAWGAPQLRPSYAISASSAAADVSFQPVRFVCRPDVSAFEGTERVG